MISISLAEFEPIAEVGTLRQEAQRLITRVQKLLTEVCTPSLEHFINIRSHAACSDSKCGSNGKFGIRILRYHAKVGKCHADIVHYIHSCCPVSTPAICQWNCLPVPLLHFQCQVDAGLWLPGGSAHSYSCTRVIVINVRVLQRESLADSPSNGVAE